jgi:hypothetical protein
MVVSLLSYAAGYMRGLTTIEANGADRAMLFACVLAGIALGAADGIANWRRFRVVVDFLVWCAAIVAAIGVIQNVTGFDIVSYLDFPGLEAKYVAIGFEARGGGIRVASTTAHYIELAALLAMTMPFAIHVARFSRERWRRRLGLFCTVIIAAGVGATISRTGILAIGLMVLILFPVWSWRMRYNVAVMGVGLVAVLAVMSPAIVTTLFTLFDNPSSNPAFTVRAARYPLLFQYVAERPLLGRGTGTWLAPQYQIMDNQWLDTLVSNGVLGVIVLAGLHFTGIVLAFLALRRSTSEEDRHVCAALISTQVIAIAVAGTFDSLSFSTYAAIMALTLGLCGTVWRLTHTRRTVRTSTARWFLD